MHLTDQTLAQLPQSFDPRVLRALLIIVPSVLTALLLLGLGRLIRRRRQLRNLTERHGFKPVGPEDRREIVRRIGELYGIAERHRGAFMIERAYRRMMDDLELALVLVRWEQDDAFPEEWQSGNWLPLLIAEVPDELPQFAISPKHYVRDALVGSGRANVATGDTNFDQRNRVLAAEGQEEHVRHLLEGEATVLLRDNRDLEVRVDGRSIAIASLGFVPPARWMSFVERAVVLAQLLRDGRSDRQMPSSA